MKLFQEEKLEIISIWSPTFLKVHLDYIQEQRRELWEKLKLKLRGDRAQLLLKPEIPWTEIWPNLTLISCWDQGQAKDLAAYLRSLFPQITVQGKGLLATEAPMTVPLIPAKGCVPVLDEVFFEFKDRKGNILQMYQLEQGKEYSVIISHLFHAEAGRRREADCSLFQLGSGSFKMLTMLKSLNHGNYAQTAQTDTFNESDWLREIAIALFQQERITLSRASKIARMHPIDFQQLISSRGTCIHYDVEDFAQDIQHLRDRGWL